MENRENGPEMVPVRENRELQILPKHMGILFAQVVNSQNLKIQDIAIFAVNFCKSVSLLKLPQISENGTGKMSS